MCGSMVATVNVVTTDEGGRHKRVKKVCWYMGRGMLRWDCSNMEPELLAWLADVAEKTAKQLREEAAGAGLAPIKPVQVVYEEPIRQVFDRRPVRPSVATTVRSIATKPRRIVL